MILSTISPTIQGDGSVDHKPLVIKIWEENFWLSWFGLAELCLRMRVAGGENTPSCDLNISREQLNHVCETTSTTCSTTATFNLARQWIEDCQNHPLCSDDHSSTAETKFVPTRLLAIGRDQNSALRLREGIAWSSNLSYVALSHCWGAEGKIKATLRKDNLSELKRSISMGSLPKTFQDAILITRGLGVEYLWIDSLCIIQDSKEDWGKESEKMGHVYSSAICTISATGSPDSTGGCIFPRVAPANKSVCVLRKQGNLSLTVRPSSSKELEEAEVDSIFKTYVDEARITTRAWTFQERILARRTLHFCNGHVLFECNTLRASEHHANGVFHTPLPHLKNDGTYRLLEDISNMDSDDPEYVKRYGTGLMKGASYERGTWSLTSEVVQNVHGKTADDKKLQFYATAALTGMRGVFGTLLLSRTTSIEEKFEFHNSWFDIINVYAPRDITYTKDRIPALAGVASLIGEQTGLTFVAGLWEQIIELSLLWNVKPGFWGTKVSNDVPTWSWAVVDKARVETQLKRYSGMLQPDPSMPFMEEVADAINQFAYQYPINYGIMESDRLKQQLRADIRNAVLDFTQYAEETPLVRDVGELEGRLYKWPEFDDMIDGVRELLISYHEGLNTKASIHYLLSHVQIKRTESSSSEQAQPANPGLSSVPCKLRLKGHICLFTEDEIHLLPDLPDFKPPSCPGFNSEKGKRRPELRLLPILEIGPISDAAGTMIMQIHGLIIEEAQGILDGAEQFRRVGYFWTEGSDSEELLQRLTQGESRRFMTLI